MCMQGYIEAGQKYLLSHNGLQFTMDYLFKLDDSYSKVVNMGYNPLIIVTGSNIIEAVQITINLITEMQLYKAHV